MSIKSTFALPHSLGGMVDHPSILDQLFRRNVERPTLAEFLETIDRGAAACDDSLLGRGQSRYGAAALGNYDRFAVLDAL
jgi:hypothetical protein